MKKLSKQTKIVLALIITIVAISFVGTIVFKGKGGFFFRFTKF